MALWPEITIFRLLCLLRMPGKWGFAKRKKSVNVNFLNFDLINSEQSIWQVGPTFPTFCASQSSFPRPSSVWTGQKKKTCFSSEADARFDDGRFTPGTYIFFKYFHSFFLLVFWLIFGEPLVFETSDQYWFRYMTNTVQRPKITNFWQDQVQRSMRISRTTRLNTRPTAALAIPVSRKTIDRST